MKFAHHPHPDMGLIWLESDNVLNPGEQLHAFPLTDDERSNAYRAWLAEGNEPGPYNPESEPPIA